MHHSKKFTSKQVQILADYLFEISKSLSMVIIVGILFPQIGGNINLLSVIIGMFICMLSLAVSIILIKDIKKVYDQ